jgi:hypothetical protein
VASGDGKSLKFQVSIIVRDQNDGLGPSTISDRDVKGTPFDTKCGGLANRLYAQQEMATGHAFRHFCERLIRERPYWEYLMIAISSLGHPRISAPMEFFLAFIELITVVVDPSPRSLRNQSINAV